MISGSSPEAGKTFVSANLAAVIAQAGQKVLLIDADMRKGGQHKVLGGRAENGLSELIAGQIELATGFHERPNGLAFSTDWQTMWVADSSLRNPTWTGYPVKEVSCMQ